MNRNLKKQFLLRVIMDDFKTPQDVLLNHLNNYSYEYIYKCPSKMFILGTIDTINRYKYKKEALDFTLDDLKELLPELISESRGVEIEFLDSDWDNLELINTNFGFKLNTDKNYMSEFFEF